MKKILFLCVAILSLCCACEKDEYESFSTLYGVVSDASTGEPISNASVLLSPGGTTKYTGSDGAFEFQELTPQQYTITVQKPGYQTNRKQVTAIVDERTEVNITLTPSSK